jgi:hypothetical protein
VGCMARGGSSPLRRMGKAPHVSGAFFVSGRRRRDGTCEDSPVLCDALGAPAGACPPDARRHVGWSCTRPSPSRHRTSTSGRPVGGEPRRRGRRGATRPAGRDAAGGRTSCGHALRRTPASSSAACGGRTTRPNATARRRAARGTPVCPPRVGGAGPRRRDDREPARRPPPSGSGRHGRAAAGQDAPGDHPRPSPAGSGAATATPGRASCRRRPNARSSPGASRTGRPRLTPLLPR